MPTTKRFKVTRTERGWAGHFCGAAHCRYHRNTLLHCPSTGVRIVVSTVGNYRPPLYEGATEVGLDKFYETMAFHAHHEGCYWDADVHQQVFFQTPCGIKTCDFDTDLAADKMHEAVVAEITAELAVGRGQWVWPLPQAAMGEET